MRVMLDTNVILSLPIFRSKTIGRAFDDIAQRQELLLCTYVIDEACEVVGRKWPKRSAALVTGDKDSGDVDVERPEVLTPAGYVERYVRG